MSNLGERLEQYFIEIINGRRESFSDKAVRCLLFLLSRVYRRAIQTRIWLYEKRIIRNRALGCLVVSIGNISCGGTGKTPVTEVFAKSLSKKGRRVAILSRGYRSKDNRSFLTKLKHKYISKEHQVPPRVVSDGKEVLLDSELAGDEPYMLATNVKGVAVVVDKDRVKSGLYAIDKFKTDTLILDDGFQYLRLKPHINIVLVDSTSPFHNHHVLPLGLLREPIKNIRRADYVFLTKSNGGNHLRHIKAFIRKHNRRAEIIECCHRPQYLENVFNRGETEELGWLKGKKVAALSAIAWPKSFEDFLEELGAELVYKKSYADHHRFNETEILDCIDKAKQAGAEFVVTTEKDAVRIPRLKQNDLDLLFLRVEIDILSGQENFDDCISRICFLH